MVSELELPELTPAQTCVEPDIEILTPGQLGPLEEESETWPCLELSGERCQILVQGIGRYRIEQGRRIMVDRRVPRDPGHQVATGDVRLYLLGAALGILLHQRQCLPLHVSAVHTPAGVWAFTGESGAGKSTMAAWLHKQHGWPLVSDDVAVIEPDASEPVLHPGPPRLKLWQDALAAMAIDTSGLMRDLTRADKYHLNAQAGFRAEPKPLKVLVELERAEPDEAPSLVPLSGVEAFRVLLRALYRAELGQLFNPPARLLTTVSALASQIQVYRFRRPWSLERMDVGLGPLMQEIEASRSASPAVAAVNER
ncbi:hypothetical protein DU490_02150 [Halomonas sp. DQ26W]|nr:hypothetical protein DU490_02150 [Halomonas sp. DQ26W]